MSVRSPPPPLWVLPDPTQCPPAVTFTRINPFLPLLRPPGPQEEVPVPLHPDSFPLTAAQRSFADAAWSQPSHCWVLPGNKHCLCRRPPSPGRCCLGSCLNLCLCPLQEPCVLSPGPLWLTLDLPKGRTGGSLQGGALRWVWAGVPPRCSAHSSFSSQVRGWASTGDGGWWEMPG